MHNVTFPSTDERVLEGQLAAHAQQRQARRVKLEDIEREIAGVYYFTAANGADGAHYERHGDLTKTGDQHEELRLLTFCVLVLRNGFTVTGESACADPAMFDAAIGRGLARQAAVNKVWPLLGFRLRDELAAA